MTVFCLLLLGGIAMSFCQWLIYCYAPVVMEMGITQKIFYIHLPLAWWALCSFLVVFAGSIIYLAGKKEAVACFCDAACELGVLFSGMALITGMIWARKAWGVWWTWDPRLTSTLVMWLVYCGYLIIGRLDVSKERCRSIRAVFGIIAFMDVPLVFFSARLFRSVHPAVFASGGGLEPEMLLTVLACAGSLGIFWLGLLLFRSRQLKGATLVEDALEDWRLLDN